MKSKIQILALSIAVLYSAVSSAESIDAKKLYMDNCAGCHQGGRVGTRFVPQLSKEQLGALSNSAVSTMIKTGIPGTLMPPWVGKLSEDEISSIAELIRTTNPENLDFTLEDAKKSLEILVDEKTLPNAPIYKSDVMDLMAVMGRGRHAQAPESKIFFFDGKTNKKVAEIETVKAPHILRYHPTNPRWAYVKTDTSEIYKIDLYTMKAVRKVKTAISGPFMAVSWDGKWIAAGSIVPGAVMILNADTLEPVKQYYLKGTDASGKEISSYSASVTASAVGNQFSVAARTLGEVWLIDPNKPDMPVTKINTKLPGEKSTWLYDAFTSADQRYLFLTDRKPNDKIVVIDFKEKKKVADIPAGCNPHVGSGGMLKSNNGKELYISANGGVCSKGTVVTVWDGKDFSLVKQIKTSNSTASVAIHPNAPYIVVDITDDGFIELIDKTTLEVVRKIHVGGNTNYPEYTRDGKYLYIAAGYMGDHLKIFDSKTFNVVADYRIGAPAGTFAHARVLWGGLKGATEKPLGYDFTKN
ncbi:nitrite reductase [Aquitalea sp. LB_tupeE]|uniref:nitrite reductase n=1 Tax=Aquitalea sp. LB_tupeE TaxID=2748078 RepID=UPI0015BA7BF7|nr:nitrite reductase [Aquitalea sp. LB_tupeE]NWK78823.1 c-type cytochrome [Aquitalea sp. LB_tupeE]